MVVDRNVGMHELKRLRAWKCENTRLSNISSAALTAVSMRAVQSVRLRAMTAAAWWLRADGPILNDREHCRSWSVTNAVCATATGSCGLLILIYSCLPQRLTLFVAKHRRVAASLLLKC